VKRAFSIENEKLEKKRKKTNVVRFPLSGYTNTVWGNKLYKHCLHNIFEVVLN
jgi:hypothetical protein